MKPSLPPWSAPVLDKNGLMTREWRTYFEQLDQWFAQLEERVEALEP